MKSEMPLIFCADMMRAWLDGRKTMTRRLDGLEEINQDPDAWKFAGFADCNHDLAVFRGFAGRVIAIPCPYPVGQIRWIRETFWQARRYPCTLPSGEPEPNRWTRGSLIHYAADGDPPNVPNHHYPNGLMGGMFAAPDPYASWEKRPSIFMERKFSRSSGRVLDHDHRCQRLQEITEEDSFAEGIQLLRSQDGHCLLPLTGKHTPGDYIPKGLPRDQAIQAAYTARMFYAALWDRLNGTRKGGMYAWERNCWDWVVKMERIEP